MVDPNRKLFWLRVMLIVTAGLWIFGPSLQGDWLMDDDFYVTQNILIHDPARLWKIWFVPGSLIEYYPVEATVQAIQWHFWHTSTLGYHLTNVFLHILGALLVWRLLAKFGLRFAWLGGFLFVVHPAAVESVAWISELKNTLSLPPFLLSLCFWIDYEERGRPRDYAWALGFFLLAMLCKISMALSPLVLLLYVWWKKDRIGWKDLVATTPFFAISLVLGLTTILVGNWFRLAHLQSTSPPEIGGWAARLALAGESIAFYFIKGVFPFHLLPIYPKWPIDPPSPIQFLPWLGMAAFLGWLWSKRMTWGRHALLGLGYFLINLLPFIGLTSVTYMSFTWVMDHFLYLPMVGLVGLITAAWEKGEGAILPKLRPLWAGMTAAILALLAWGSNQYAAIFIGPEQLWSYTTLHNPTSWLAHNNLGNVLFETDRMPQAIREYEATLQINPDSVEANNNLGVALDQLGRTPEAIAHFQKALHYNPHFALSLVNLGHALEKEGRPAEAIQAYRKALLIEPHDGDTRARLEKLGATPGRD
jgi:hypothetical protein